MIKKLLSIVAISAGFASFAQTTPFSLMYHFPAVTPTTGVVDPSPAPTAVGVTSGSFTAVGTGTASSSTGVFSFTGWGTGSSPGGTLAPSSFTGAIDLAKYYELVLTPQGNYQVTLNGMTFGSTRSGTGVRNWAVRTNKDGYTTNISATYTALNAAASHSVPVIVIQGGNTFLWNDDALSTGAAAFANNNISGVAFSGPNFTNQSTPFNIRVYGWNAEGGAGTFRIDSAVVNGTATFSLGVGLNKISHDLNSKISLYPNPNSTGIAILNVAGVNVTKVEVVNVLGAIVASQNIALNEEKIKLDVKTLPVGNYFVRITSPDGVVTEKLIITE